MISSRENSTAAIGVLNAAASAAAPPTGTSHLICLLLRPVRCAMTGTIRTLRVDKGFGFIKDGAGKEYFFHQSAIQGEGMEDLREGDSVEFDVGQGPKGPRAENVRRTST